MKNKTFLLAFPILFLWIFTDQDFNNKHTATSEEELEINFQDTIYPVESYAVKFPKDEISSTENLNDTVTFMNPNGQYLSVYVSQKFYEIYSPHFCRYGPRSYRVINWNEYDGEADPILIERNENCNEENGEEDIWLIVDVDSMGNKIVYLDRDSIPDNTNPLQGTNRCDYGDLPDGHWANSLINEELNSVGYWIYTQMVTFKDSIAPEIVLEQQTGFEGVNNSCESIGSFSFSVDNYDSFYAFIIKAEVFLDKGNDGVLDEEITSIVIDTLPENEFVFSFSDTLPAGNHSYYFYVQDLCKNKDTLTLELNISDSGINGFEGEIKSWENVLLEGIQVFGSQQTGEEIRTDSEGSFEICVDASIPEVIIAPYFNDNPVNGISGFDLIKINKHILGIQPLDNPYKLIAADVNNSGSITVSDLIELQSIILQINTEFDNNTSWRFVEESFVFPDGWNLDSEFPELLSVSGEGDFSDLNFIGVKIGHVAGSTVGTVD